MQLCNLQNPRNDDIQYNQSDLPIPSSDAFRFVCDLPLLLRELISKALQGLLGRCTFITGNLICIDPMPRSDSLQYLEFKLYFALTPKPSSLPKRCFGMLLSILNLFVKFYGIFWSDLTTEMPNRFVWSEL